MSRDFEPRTAVIEGLNADTRAMMIAKAEAMFS